MADPQLDSDDDAPEEITLNEGREEAEQSRRNEEENSKRLAAELKEKRKAWSEKKSNNEVSEGDRKAPKKAVPEKLRSRKRKGRPADASNSGEELTGKVVGSVMLDESIVQLIRAREKQVGKGVGESKHKYIEEPEPELEREPKRKLQRLQNMTVVALRTAGFKLCP